ncbi:FAD:protein FMN transferase [Alienimonas californiensis]|uniref:FAD:protein FMN transferase n=1 Tax=Alienimonas californiensis TaxID=2527989 RepID=A0A517P9X1_9PLAN|nr:FAD:protein FMN transferase [Alienimonas californiensis]QDT16164.1 Thiamine biosynthesis lipoprotein ApbE precursor [Alienimonas californiensis]
MPSPTPNRRAFLTGVAARDVAVDALADAVAGGVDAAPPPPAAGSSVRISQRSMACEFACALNPGDRSAVMHAGDALAIVHELEGQLSVYRPDSEVSRLNDAGAADDVEPGLFELLTRAKELAERTDGAFTPLAGSLVAAWRAARAENRILDEADAARAAERCGTDRLSLHPETRSVRLGEGSRIDLGGIGKGYALDRAAAHLIEQEVSAFLLHGGRSSVLARGPHHESDGWPIGLGDPHRTTRRLGTVVLQDRAMATSGSNVQFYRHQGRRLGHLLDPRTGWPADPDRPGGLLSVVAFAPLSSGTGAADADALATALFVLGLPAATAFLDANPAFGGILVAPPKGGLLPVTIRNVDPGSLFLDPAAVLRVD